MPSPTLDLERTIGVVHHDERAGHRASRPRRPRVPRPWHSRPRGGRAGPVGATSRSRVRLRTEPGSSRCSATLMDRIAGGEPRLDVREREAAVGLVGPRHRRPRPVAPRVDRPAAQTDRIPEPVVRHGHVGHPDLVAVVEDRRPAERQEHHERGADLPVVAVAPPGREPRRIVVRAGPRGPRLRRDHRLFLFDDRTHLVAQLREDERDVQRQMELVGCRLRRTASARSGPRPTSRPPGSARAHTTPRSSASGGTRRAPPAGSC